MVEWFLVAVAAVVEWFLEAVAAAQLPCGIADAWAPAKLSAALAATDTVRL